MHDTNPASVTFDEWSGQDDQLKFAWRCQKAEGHPARSSSSVMITSHCRFAKLLLGHLSAKGHAFGTPATGPYADRVRGG